MLKNVDLQHQIVSGSLSPQSVLLTPIVLSEWEGVRESYTLKEGKLHQE